jgi:hypothetical protein
MSFPDTYQGYDVRLVIHAHVMAESVEAALERAVAGLRKQTRVQVTSITPVGEVPDSEDASAAPADVYTAVKDVLEGSKAMVEAKHTIQTKHERRVSKRERKAQRKCAIRRWKEKQA